MLSIDVEADFTPLEFRCESAPVARAMDPEAWFLEWRIVTKWEPREGVWVPARYEFAIPLSPVSNTHLQKNIEYHWKTVNQPIDSDLFSYRTFDVPAKVGIQDVSSGETKWIKPLPNESFQMSGAFPVGEDRRQQRLVRNVVIVHVVALIGFILFFLVRRKRQWHS